MKWGLNFMDMSIPKDFLRLEFDDSLLLDTKDLNFIFSWDDCSIDCSAPDEYDCSSY